MQEKKRRSGLLKIHLTNIMEWFRLTCRSTVQLSSKISSASLVQVSSSLSWDTLAFMISQVNEARRFNVPTGLPRTKKVEHSHYLSRSTKSSSIKVRENKRLITLARTKGLQQQKKIGTQGNVHLILKLNFFFFSFFLFLNVLVKLERPKNAHRKR